MKKFIYTLPFFCLIAIFFIAACDFSSPQSKVKDLVGDKYNVIKQIGEGGEAIVFLVEDKRGKRLAAKFWPKDQKHNHLRGTTPFDNSVKVHTLLKDNTHVNHLHEAIGNQLMILDYLEGTELQNYLAQDLTENQITSITRQIISALTEIMSKDVVPFDVSAENLLITTDDKANFIDTGAYIIVDDLIKANQEFEPKEFNIFNLTEVKKIMTHEKKKESGDYFVVDSEKYEIIPPLTLYTTLAGQMDLFSRLLTKLVYIKQNRSQKAPNVEVYEITDKFADNSRFIARPWTEEIEERSRNILHMAKLKNEAPNYTAENFLEDVGETVTISNMIFDKTKLCLEDVTDCLKKD